MWTERNKVLCICLDWQEKVVNGNKIIETFKKYCEEHSEVFDPYFVFEEFPTIAFKEKYIINITDHKNIVNRVFNVMDELGTIWK
jgi:hypothetical protein